MPTPSRPRQTRGPIDCSKKAKGLLGRFRRAGALEVIDGPTGRRNRPDEVKARIGAETLELGASLD